MVSEPIMADQESTTSLPPSSLHHSGNQPEDLVIPAPLKFLISNIKNLISNTLTSDNYAIWRIQVLQQFTANGYAGHLTGASPSPTDPTTPAFNRWQLVDNNLLSALFSTISPSILPYVITAKTAQEVWQVLERRLQPTCRSRIIQLKNELHHVQMKDLTMQQYLSHIKSIVDNIAASGSTVDPEDIIIHILNGLPTSYNSFKAAIRTNPVNLDLDNLYSLLCSEEINVSQEQAKETLLTASNTALYSSSYNPQRGNKSKKYFKPKQPPQNQHLPMISQAPQTPTSTTRITCQICGKAGHIAINCWHRCNFKYAPTSSRPQQALSAQTSSTNSADWILDTGASAHLTPDIHNVQYPNSYSGHDSVSIANGSTVPIHNSGQGLLPLPDTPRKLQLRNILHVPSLAHNLLSVSKLTVDNPISIRFDANGFVIKDKQARRPLLRGQLRDGLYRIQNQQAPSLAALHANIQTAQLWHRRLGHPHRQILSTLSHTIPDIKNVSPNFSCISCSVAKSHKLHFNRTTSFTNCPFELIHTDVWGPAPIPSTDGFRYYVLFTDDFTRFTWIYLMNNKHETFAKFKIFYKLIKTQFLCKPKFLRSDGGGEFLSNEFTNFLHTHGIQRQLSCPHTLEKNGVAERKHRHLLDLTRTLLHASNLPSTFWSEALATANYVINRLPSTAINLDIPFQRLHGRLPDYSILRTFGCLCFPWLKPYAPNKLAPRSHKCIFLGYSSAHKGYRCYNLTDHKIYISRHVVFHEEIFPYQTQPIQNLQHKTTMPNPISPYLLTPASIQAPTPHTTNSNPTTEQIIPPLPDQGCNPIRTNSPPISDTSIAPRVYESFHPADPSHADSSKIRDY
ncbi:hypothetical protein KFK09_024941 [Dendrobium nobile]|uniref:Retrovirus-related Pol polyprotein from transposon TNT 1-94 n=1 Tax=Dendrobium nobile TaxID=94219 RepID=A0A8T3AF70_DENNO|nr:hypothetical protein KFK09_024941 [Dendrobium nobile]